MDLRQINVSDIPFQRIGAVASKLLTDSKILLTLVSLFSAIYFVGYETAFKPNMEELQIREEALKTQLAEIDKRKAELAQFKAWEQQLKGLSTRLVPISDTEVASVVASNQYGKLKDLATGKIRSNPDAPQLPAPHDILKQIDVKSVDKATVPLVIPTPGGTSAPQRPSLSPGGPATAPPGEISPPPSSGDAPTSGGSSGAGITINLERYNYEIKATGTYPALADFINQLVLQPELIAIRSITMEPAIKPDESSRASFRPDPKTSPDFPVEITMTIAVSVYLYPTGAKS